MSDDLIARLESVEHNVAHDELCRDAARRVRELEAELDRAHVAFDGTERMLRGDKQRAEAMCVAKASVLEGVIRERDALRAEVERLRAALLEISISECRGVDLSPMIMAALAGEKP